MTTIHQQASCATLINVFSQIGLGEDGLQYVE